jgi:ABC-type lipoprotein release transport system permease subunit
MESFKMLLQIAMRSLFAHKVKSLIVGVILVFGTFLLTFLLTFFGNIRESMERSITGSLIGHLQLVNDKAKDDLAFFGFGASAAQDLGIIDNYVKVRDAIEKVPNVVGVVPMGRDFASAMGGNLLDEKITEMRDAAKAGDTARLHKLASRIRQIAELLQEEYSNKLKIAAKKDEVQQNLVVLARVLSPEFWVEFDQNTAAGLDYLDTKLAQLQTDSNGQFLAYLGTDLDLFAKKFEKFRIVEGTAVPAGHHGMLLSKTFHEEQAKNTIARQFDILRDGIHKDSKRISDGAGKREKADPKLQEASKRLGRQTKRLLYELGPDESAAVQAELKKQYGSPDDLAGLVTKLLNVDQGNFDEHYKTFYAVVAPRIKLYSVRVGDVLTLRAFTRSGYTRATNVKIYGTFQFDGLDGSLVASAYNLMDMMTFRDLYGFMTPERRAELDEMRKAVGVKELGQGGDSEADLFGEGSGTAKVEQAPTGSIGLEAGAIASRVDRKNNDSKTFTQADIDDGVIINAAVLLKDGNKMSETRLAIDELSKKDGLHIKTIDWESAAGIIGQMIWVFRIVLALFFVVAFIVILAVINNAMLMATKDRVIEIGTMRAIGAQRNFVLSMILLETFVLWLIAASIGLALAAGLIGYMHSTGIAAGTEPIMIVLFGGPRLYPHVTLISVVVSLACIGVVSLLATLYPAWSATRVPPIVAMQRRE